MAPQQDVQIAPDGERLTRDTRPFVVEYKGATLTVDLPGYYPAGEGESVHVGDDMAEVDRALRLLKEKVDGVPAPETIRRVRQKLKLSQREAGALLGVGPSAFDKYARGVGELSGPTIRLIKLLDLEPSLVDRLRAMTGESQKR